MEKARNILFFGDFGCTTGFGSVSKQLIDHWTKMLNSEDRITVLALNNFAKEAYEYNDKVVVIPALNTKEERDKDPYCRNTLLKFMFNMKFTHVFLFNDVEVFNPLKLPIESFPVEANPVVVLFVYQLNVVLDDPVKLINPELFPLQTVTSSIGLTKAPGIISTESFK